MSCTSQPADEVSRQQASSGVPAQGVPIPPGLEGFAAYLCDCHDAKAAEERLAQDLEAPSERLRDLLRLEGFSWQIEAGEDLYLRQREEDRQYLLEGVCRVLRLGDGRLPQDHPAYALQEACRQAVSQVGKGDTPRRIAAAILEALGDCPLAADLVSEDGWGGLSPGEIRRRELESRLVQGQPVEIADQMGYPDLIQRFGA